MVDAQTITMLVQIAATEAPAIIAAVQSKGGTVQDVGPILAKDAAMIDGDIQTLKGEQLDGGQQ